jgi:hypothetical protein
MHPNEPRDRRTANVNTASPKRLSPDEENSMQEAMIRASEYIQGRMRQWLAPAVVLASVIPHPVASSMAADKPGKAERVATKSDDTARIGAGDKSPLAPALEMAKSSRDATRKLGGYTTTFIKREVLKDKDEPVRQVMEMKFREEPFSVYLKFIEPHAGREVIYVDGKNKGKMLVHESGIASIVGIINASPDGKEVMKENRYPITMIGMTKLLDTVIEQWSSELKVPGCEVKSFPQAKVGNIECKMIESTHPTEIAGVRFHKTRLYIDKSTNLPVRVEQYGFPKKGGEAPLIEEYSYTEIKEAKLTDFDFDVKNTAYKFQ